MKILEAQNAILTNYEVYSHLNDQKERYAQPKRKGPPNYETVVREVSQRRVHPLSLSRASMWPVAAKIAIFPNGKRSASATNHHT
ncbi:hypothetical protein IMZ48_05680 [Candidatus Bathyarchaeota archaeon]|nr:hypothetical protein [Candidatus Bathyarchaeota archaeon]